MVWAAGSLGTQQHSSGLLTSESCRSEADQEFPRISKESSFLSWQCCTALRCPRCPWAMATPRQPARNGQPPSLCWHLSCCWDADPRKGREEESQRRRGQRRCLGVDCSYSYKKKGEMGGLCFEFSGEYWPVSGLLSLNSDPLHLFGYKKNIYVLHCFSSFSSPFELHRHLNK